MRRGDWIGLAVLVALVAVLVFPIVRFGPWSE